MALRDVAAEFVGDVLHGVIIREQHLTSKLDLQDGILVTSPPVLQIGLTYRDVAVQFVSEVLRGVATREQQVATKIDSRLDLVTASEASSLDVSIEEGVKEQQQSPSVAHDSKAKLVVESLEGSAVATAQRSGMAGLIQTFASEVVTTAIEKAVGANRATRATTGSRNSEVPQQATEEKEGSLQPQQPTRPVSRRQLIHKIAKATNDHVLSIVLQSKAFSLGREETSPSVELTGPVVETPTAPVDHEYEDDEDDCVPAPSTPDVHISSPPPRLAAEEKVDTEQMPSPELHVDDQPPSTDSTADASIQSQVASAFIRTLLLQVSTGESRPKPQILVQPPPPSADQETSSSGVHSRRKSPNVHKRNLVKKDSVPSSPSATQPSPSPPPPEKPVSDDASSLTATVPTQDQAKSKRAGKRDLRPKHHPHKTHEKAASGDDTSTLEAIASPQTTKSKLTLPLDDSLSLFSATSSPLSSARLAQEIYRPRNPIYEASPSPLVLKKPTAGTHPRRHPHHIQNAAIAKETSYSRDSPRADAIASELQRKAKSSAPDAVITSHLLLPLTTTSKTPSIPAAASSAQQSPAHSPKKQSSRDNKNVSRSPAKMRSGFCQQCVFEGRSCKINDCLKHQLLK